MVWYLFFLFTFFHLYFNIWFENECVCLFKYEYTNNNIWILCNSKFVPRLLDYLDPWSTVWEPLL